VDLHNHRILASHCLKWHRQILRNGLFFISMLETSAMRQLSISSFSHPSSLNMSRILLSIQYPPTNPPRCIRSSISIALSTRPPTSMKFHRSFLLWKKRRISMSLHLTKNLYLNNTSASFQSSKITRERLTSARCRDLYLGTDCR